MEDILTKNVIPSIIDDAREKIGNFGEDLVSSHYENTGNTETGNGDFAAVFL